MIKSNSQYLRLDPLPKEKDLSFLNALSNKNHVQCPGVDQLDREILSRSLLLDLDPLNFATVTTVTWIWHSLSSPIEIQCLISSECYSIMNLLQCHKQYFLKSLTTRCNWMKLVRTITNGRFGLLATVPSLQLRVQAAFNSPPRCTNTTEGQPPMLFLNPQRRDGWVWSAKQFIWSHFRFTKQYC
jgi:hypothetical protein